MAIISMTLTWGRAGWGVSAKPDTLQVSTYCPRLRCDSFFLSFFPPGCSVCMDTFPISLSRVCVYWTALVKLHWTFSWSDKVSSSQASSLFLMLVFILSPQGASSKRPICSILIYLFIYLQKKQIQKQLSWNFFEAAVHTFHKVGMVYDCNSCHLYEIHLLKMQNLEILNYIWLLIN